MLDPSKEALTARLDIKDDFELDARQAAVVVSIVKHEGFIILQKLMEEEIKLFNLRLMNTPVTEPDKVLSNHMSAQTIVQWYSGFMSRVAQQIKIDNYTKAGLGTLANPAQSGVSPDFE